MFQKKPPSLNNYYALLGLFLSPCKDIKAIGFLRDFIHKAKMDWGRLLHMANLHFCSPLLFVMLRKDGLLPLLSIDLQTYLKHLHAANIERQETFRQATTSITNNFLDVGIPTILLKGASNFCDDLYRDLGARMMSDVDLLVKAKHIEKARNIMIGMGYREQVECKNPPHHLPRFIKLGSLADVEIHFRAANGQAGRVLPTKLCWIHKESAVMDGLSTFVLPPTLRLLHNTIHALLTASAMQNPITALNDLSEFVHLAHRYESDLDWNEWFTRGVNEGLNRQFRGYLTLANRLMHLPMPFQLRSINFSRLYVYVKSYSSNKMVDSSTIFNTQQGKVSTKVNCFVFSCYIFVYRRIMSLIWRWRNVDYEPGTRKIPSRFISFSEFMLGHINSKLKIHGKKIENVKIQTVSTQKVTKE
jgi:hypothetical protein